MLPFALISNYTLAEKGTSRVSVPGTSDYRQISGTFGVTMAGDFLPIQFIYEGKTKNCQPKFNFLKELHITQTPNHWANEDISITMLNEILIPYIDGKRKELNLQSKRWLLICDVFNGQSTDAVRDTAKNSNSKMIPVSSNWTNYFQPIDLAVNKSSKDLLLKR